LSLLTASSNLVSISFVEANFAAYKTNNRFFDYFVGLDKFFYTFFTIMLRKLAKATGSVLPAVSMIAMPVSPPRH
jgi:hypothetical protein